LFGENTELIKWPVVEGDFHYDFQFPHAGGQALGAQVLPGVLQSSLPLTMYIQTDRIVYGEDHMGREEE